MSRRILYGRLVYPVYHALRRDGINQARKELAEGETLDADALERLQRRKLGNLLQFAYEHVPYYREVMQRGGNQPVDFLEEGRFQQFPVLDKGTIRREGSRLHADVSGGRRGTPNSTSGSTGEPTKFLTDVRARAFRLADELRGKHWAGFQLGNREATLWGAQMDIRRARQWRGRLHGIITGHRLLSSFDLSAERADDYITHIQRFRPSLLVAYPSALEAFSEHCERLSVTLGDSIKSVICSAETLFEHQLALFDRVFGKGSVYNRYGAREVGVIAHECRAHHGLHVSADRLLVEIIDENGEACPPGVTGDVLITDFESFAMPFIRYRIGDRAAWSDSQTCDCGRRLPLLSGVEGRALDVVRAPSGNAVGGTFFTILFRTQPGIQQFQVQQDQHGDLVIRYVSEDRLNQNSIEYYRGAIQERLGTDITISFHRMPDILPISASGKQRLVASDYRPDDVGVGGARAERRT